ncbi:hypothetical protein C2S52_006954 [Perilla frutescens var. hirtella]|nr:hypothetical protein C2S51_008893 [Perilla frutescens var. frutescens]KAH6787402.1 hypothetical protein C2S52_006954 [Perilla frutescens var. hirtella]
MKIEAKVVSIETIKPSSPTPKPLKKHYLSFLDQLAPPYFSSRVYFYSSNPTIPNSQKSNLLKKSLSETLSRFYPLAGRLIDNLYVDCNDRGTPFFEAEANCDLSQVITNPDPENMKKFLPYKLNESQDICMAVQATYFHCGGLAVGLLISHKIADASSLTLFSNTWSAVSRNGDGGGVPFPKFDGATYFPPHDVSGFSPSTEGMMKEELTTRIFTFPAAKISVLRERFSGGSGGLPGRRPSRVEALSAFIWTRFISATGVKADQNIKTYIVNQAVNLRTRVDPPLSEYHFGNLIWASIARLAADDDDVEVINKFREAMKAVISAGYDVAKLKELNLMKEMMGQARKGELVSLSFTSYCGFAVYEVDFGWGKPDWVGLPGLPYKNFVIFKDTKGGDDGIEAMVHLRKRDMQKFEDDLEMKRLKE